VATIVAAGVAASAHACPIGSFPSLDNWGNQICKTLDTGQTTTIQGSVDNCPIGTHPWVDNWGNKICQSRNGLSASERVKLNHPRLRKRRQATLVSHEPHSELFLAITAQGS
jgi:hypothetical protein